MFLVIENIDLLEGRIVDDDEIDSATRKVLKNFKVARKCGGAFLLCILILIGAETIHVFMVDL